MRTHALRIDVEYAARIALTRGTALLQFVQLSPLFWNRETYAVPAHAWRPWRTVTTGDFLAGCSAPKGRVSTYIRAGPRPSCVRATRNAKRTSWYALGRLSVRATFTGIAFTDPVYPIHAFGGTEPLCAECREPKAAHDPGERPSRCGRPLHALHTARRNPCGADAHALAVSPTSGPPSRARTMRRDRSLLSRADVAIRLDAAVRRSAAPSACDAAIGARSRGIT